MNHDMKHKHFSKYFMAVSYNFEDIISYMVQNAPHESQNCSVHVRDNYFVHIIGVENHL